MGEARTWTVSARGRDEIQFLALYVLDELLDDPSYVEDAKETWATLKIVAEEVGLDLAELAREGGTTYERERLREIVGEPVG